MLRRTTWLAVVGLGVVAAPAGPSSLRARNKNTHEIKGRFGGRSNDPKKRDIEIVGDAGVKMNASVTERVQQRVAQLHGRKRSYLELLLLMRDKPVPQALKEINARLSGSDRINTTSAYAVRANFLEASSQDDAQALDAFLQNVSPGRDKEARERRQVLDALKLKVDLTRYGDPSGGLMVPPEMARTLKETGRTKGLVVFTSDDGLRYLVAFGRRTLTTSSYKKGQVYIRNVIRIGPDDSSWMHHFRATPPAQREDMLKRLGLPPLVRNSDENRRAERVGVHVELPVTKPADWELTGSQVGALESLAQSAQVLLRWNVVERPQEVEEEMIGATKVIKAFSSGLIFPDIHAMKGQGAGSQEKWKIRPNQVAALMKQFNLAKMLLLWNKGSSTKEIGSALGLPAEEVQARVKDFEDGRLFGEIRALGPQ